MNILFDTNVVLDVNYHSQHTGHGPATLRIFSGKPALLLQWAAKVYII